MLQRRKNIPAHATLHFRVKSLWTVPRRAYARRFATSRHYNIAVTIQITRTRGAPESRKANLPGGPFCERKVPPRPPGCGSWLTQKPSGQMPTPRSGQVFCHGWGSCPLPENSGCCAPISNSATRGRPDDAPETGWRQRSVPKRFSWASRALSSRAPLPRSAEHQLGSSLLPTELRFSPARLRKRPHLRFLILSSPVTELVLGAPRGTALRNGIFVALWFGLIGVDWRALAALLSWLVDQHPPLI